MILLQSEIIDNINDRNNILDVLSRFDDEDFNGNNGDEYLWSVCKSFGCKTNKEFALKCAAEQEKPNFIIGIYFDFWLNTDESYKGFSWDLIEVDNNKHVLTLARVTED